MYSAYFFDAYGTLFDVHAATRKLADRIGPDHGLLSEIWRQKQLEYSWTRTLMDRYEDFWLLTQQALDFAFAKVPSANRDMRKELLDAYWTLDCFEEVPEVLGALKEAGVQTGILSNGSTDMLEAAIKSSRLGALLDHTISVDEIGRFKAVPAVYQMVVDVCRTPPGAISFQSSNRWDIAGAHAFGFRTVWLNRGSQPDEYGDLPPDLTLNDLNGLVGQEGPA